jgi:hypothetical protein
MQIRCNVCSTIVAIGDDVARALARRGGSVPCRNCKAPILVTLPNAGAHAPTAAGEAAARAPGPGAGQARPASPMGGSVAARAVNAGQAAAPAGARTTGPVPQARGATAAGDVPASRRAMPGVAASARNTLPFGPPSVSHGANNVGASAPANASTV